MDRASPRICGFSNLQLMDLQLEDKVVLVTGGAKGIGAAITKTCAQEGAIVVAVDRDLLACQQLHDELHTQGLQIRFIAMDLSPATNCKDDCAASDCNFRPHRWAGEQRGRQRQSRSRTRRSSGVSLFARAESSALLQYGALRAPTFEANPRINCQHQLRKLLLPARAALQDTLPPRGRSWA